MSEINVSYEVVKLLLQVAWADHSVGQDEGLAILAFGKRHGLSEEQLEQIQLGLEGKTQLPLPNLGALKPHKRRVLSELKELLLSDLHVSDEEESILKQISALL